jgi:hypothetical protein
MSLPVVFGRAAGKEFDEASDWYESRRPGRGDLFAAAICQVLDPLPSSRGCIPRCSRTFARRR